LIATDLDGTLLRSDRTISDRSRLALRRAEAAGALVVLVTSRATPSVRLIAQQAGVSGLAICSNGAIVYDLDRDQIVRHLLLHPDSATRFVLAVREAVPGVCFGFVRGAGFACEPAYRLLARPGDPGAARLDTAAIGDAIELCAEQPTRVIVRHEDLTVDDLLARILDLGLEGFEVSHSGSPCVEVAAAGVTKAEALAWLCAEHGIAVDEVVAFGDAPNDLPMLRWAGHSVAMANAHPSVPAVADEVAPSNDDDGVAVVLERLFGQGQAGTVG
jgi:hydroxymethylpyrimidine pyrophosphatase-like HAD family hydrolase